MQRSILVATLAVLVSPATLPAQPSAAARRPVTVYLVDPADRPDKVTIMAANRPQTHEVKHCALTWCGSLFWYFDVGPDCFPTQVETTVVEPPAHGRIILNDGTVPSLGLGRLAPYARDDPRAACPKLTIRNGVYLPNPGYVGRDHATISFREGDVAFTDAIEIVVRRAERPNPLAAPDAH